MGVWVNVGVNVGTCSYVNAGVSSHRVSFRDNNMVPEHGGRRIERFRDIDVLLCKSSLIPWNNVSAVGASACVNVGLCEMSEYGVVCWGIMRVACSDLNAGASA